MPDHTVPARTSTVRSLTPDDDLTLAGHILRESYLALPGFPASELSYIEEVCADVAGRVAEREPHTVVLGGFVDGELRACLTFVSGGPHYEFADPDATSFRYFGVSPAAQGSGLGAVMVQWCIDETRRLGKTRLLIHTLGVMEAAQHLYLRLGFVRLPELDEEFDGSTGLAFACDV